LIGEPINLHVRKKSFFGVWEYFWVSDFSSKNSISQTNERLLWAPISTGRRNTLIFSQRLK
jgi:hypothetical protein